MTTDHTRTTRERTEGPDALQRAKELAEKYIPLHDWDPVNEEPVDTYGYPETQRHGFQQGYLACHADMTARDAEPTTDPELRAAVNALKDAAKSINVIVSTGIDLSPEELDLIDACASGAAQGWLMAQAARIEGDEA